MDIDSCTVAICLATYNGAKYIREQINSILSQSYTNWRLFVRDDGSSDSTVAIVKEYVHRHPQKICLIEDDHNCGSSKKNFSAILSWVTKNHPFSYFMFCDQDDVWTSEKIEKSMRRMIEEEKNNEFVLVHTDLKVVDADLKILGESFFAYRALSPKENRLNRLLVQNNVTGCTMLWNKNLNRLINLEDSSIVMHDWWIALVASAFGRIACVEEPTMLYRQHGNNVVGATRVNTLGFIVKRLFGHSHVRKTLQMSVQQAKAFLNCYSNRMSTKQKKIVSAYAELDAHSKLGRVLVLFKGKYFKQGLVQRIGQILYI